MERGDCRNCGAKKADGRCPNCIIGGIKLELKKPLNESWDETGPQLRALRNVSHRLMNAAMLGNIADLHAYDTRKREGKLDPDEKLKIYSYQHILNERASYAKWAEDKVLELRSKKSKDKAAVEKNAAEIERLSLLADQLRHLPTEMLSFINKTVDAKFRLWMKSRAEERLPMYKKGAPIMLPPVGAKISKVDTGHVVLKLKLRNEGAVDVVAIPVSGSAWASMKYVADGTAKAGACNIVYDLKKKKWIAILSVIRPRPPAPAMKSDVVLAVNRGRHNFLYAVANDGKAGRVVWPGSDILSFKQQMKARLYAFKSMRHHRGGGARGHGKNRFFKCETALKDKEANFVRTVCQQAAAELNRVATQVGAGTIIIEDFGTIADEDLRYVESWPWYQLKQAIAHMCDKTSRKLQEVESQYISSECPQCGYIDPTQAKNTGMFHCSKCEYSREIDFVACYTELRKSGADMESWNNAFERAKRLSKKLKAEARREAAS